MWALIVSGEVRETTDIDPDGRFHPDFDWVQCDDSVRERMLYDGAEFTEAPADE